MRILILLCLILIMPASIYADNMFNSGGIFNKGGGTIPEYTSDPSSPTAQQSWVLYTAAHKNLQTSVLPIGMLFAGGVAATWKFSYYTNEGTIKRVTLQ